MDRWKQYGGLAGLFAVCLAAGLWGFTSTGGALPWANRSAQALQRGVQQSGGALVDTGRGIVVAGPIRNGGMMLEFVGVVVLLAVIGIGLYVYADRYREHDESDRATR
ncbi:cobalamin transport operon protein [Salinigranum rubrum]|uniref:Cobalamin transport operon protein n=1 Tax=Salinigranum rubrum TaxID=755307 RepID=A0A2I8VL25_9EURY|nr:cobalamin transport operon protein [Salinigranum rubrum]AUV82595.1 cobalamin transport operon protein [Salinigranum rubrum]